MYAPFAMIFPEESGLQRLAFSLSPRNPFGLGASSYELYDIYPAMQEGALYDIFLNVSGEDGEIQATLFCQLDPSRHEIHLTLSELHLQRPSAPALLEAVEVQFNHSRGQQWAEILLARAERMQQAFLDALPDAEGKKPAEGLRLLRDEALEMLLSQDDPTQQELLIDALVREMRQMMLIELEAHRLSQQQRENSKIIQFPGRRRLDWQDVPWLELQLSLSELPEIWRRIRVPDCLTLTQLHRVIQTAMGWQDRADWKFRQSRTEYISHAENEAGWDQSNADITTLAELLPRKGASLSYSYAEHWQHAIKVSKRQKTASAARLLCSDGAMAGPPEDCGGPEGFRQLQHVLLKKRRSRADKLLLAELAGYDPAHFEREAVNRQLSFLEQDLQS